MKRSQAGTVFGLLLSTLILLPTSRAEAGELTTSETLVMYARESLQRGLGEELQLAPGSIELEDEAGVDVGKAFRGVVGAGKKGYEVQFRAIERHGQQYTGRTKLVVQAISNMDDDKGNDNNTTLRGQDLGTGRLIRAQLQVYSAPAVAVTSKSLFLRPIK